ncbi:MAG: hypothetical protein Q8O56_06165 [Solirubrobacteraceae bacterium]|nr:hypothetical protein [Solirubrobacteraceae bacterium]
MTVVALNPNATVSNTGSIAGGGTAHGALSNDNDANHVALSASQAVRVAMANMAAGAPYSAILTVRVSTASGGGANLSWPPLPDADVVFYASATGWVNRSYALYGLTKPNVDNAEVLLSVFGGVMSISRVRLIVGYLVPPTVTAVAPTGTQSSPVPSVTWTRTSDPETMGLTHRVRIFSQAQYSAGGFDPATSPATYDSGVIPGGATSHPMPELVAGSYRAYVMVRQQHLAADVQSSWAFGQWFYNITPPPVPTLSVNPNSAAGRIALLSTGTGTAVRHEIQRSIDNGQTWTRVRTAEGTTGSVPGLVAGTDDYETPIGDPVVYRARSFTAGGIPSAWHTPAATQLDSDWWLKHPNRPILNVKLDGGKLRNYPGSERGGRHHEFHAVAARHPVIVSDTRQSARGTITLQLETRVERGQLDELLDTAETLLLHGPASAQEPDRYVRVVGHRRRRVVDNAHRPRTLEELDWIEVGRPPGAMIGPSWEP